MHREGSDAESPRMILGTPGLIPLTPDSFGVAQYGPFGPPFGDPRLQASYEAQWRKLSASSMFITDGTARDLVATVMNAAMAAGEASIPKIEAKVKAAVLATIPKIRTEVESGAGSAVKSIIFGAVSLIGLLGITFWGFSKIGKR